MLDSVSSVITVVLGVASVVSLIIGVASWHGSTVKKAYAAERNFNHVKNDLKQLSGSMAVILDDAKERFDQIDHTLETIQQSVDELKSRGLFR